MGVRHFFFFWFLIGLFLVFTQLVAAAECRRDCNTLEECPRFIEECEEVLVLYQSANLKNKETLADFETQVNRLGQMVSSASKQINQLKENLIEREADLEVQKILLNQRIRRFYIYQRGFSVLTIFFSGQNNGHFVRNLFYQQLLANEDRKAIEDLSGQIEKLAKDKESLEEKRIWLAEKKKMAEEKVAFFRREIEKAEGYINILSNNLASLTSKQKSLLAARSGTFTSSVGDVPISTIPCSGPPGSPTFCDPGGGDWFAVFSFGAWTHRKGMSQYGAKGRAESGQNYRQILQAYYGREPVNKDTGGNIVVSGFGGLNFENYYLYGIAEMPSSWNKEALKAQAVAARSYAYRYLQEGRAICTTQACQVFSKSKADNSPSAWREAVNETKGQVIEGIVAYYSSTAGGYLTYPSGIWDTTDSQGGAGFAPRAWESKAGSPWFYSSWYTQSYNPNSSNCNRSHPWMKSEELADILNAWRVGADERILPITINQCQVGGVTGNSYSVDELRNKANEKGGGFSSVSSVSVVYSNDGSTSSVTFNTDRGQVTLSGSEFKQAFNLRAPGYIAIRSPLFNVEKK